MQPPRFAASLVLFSLSFFAATPTLQAATAPIRINSGNRASIEIGPNGAEWLPDQYFKGGDVYYQTAFDPATRRIFGMARYGLYGNFSYFVPVDAGDYTVNLYFAELQFERIGDRIFDVVINGQVVLNDYDILKLTPRLTMVMKTFPAKSVNGQIRIDFTGVKRFGTVSAIEILPSSTSTPAPTVTVTPSTSSTTPGQSVQFSAAVQNAASSTVVWQVLPSTLGSVTSTGKFTASLAISQTTTGKVRASLQSDPTIFSEAAVTVTVASTPPPTTGTGNQFFVAPGGKSTGNGSITSPWDLKTALAHPTAVKPGDTIWVRGGTYPGLFRSVLAGTASSPIVVRNYNNERATIDTGKNTGGAGLEVYGQDTWYWGLEIMSSNPNRITGTTGSSGGANLGLVDGVDTFGTRNKFINLVVHDTRQGYGFWEYGIDNEIYGNLLYYNGWAGGDRGHGHAIYSQNRTGIKTIEDNIQFKGYAMGIRAIGSEAAAAKHYRFRGNISFESGALYGNKWTNFAVAVGSGAEDILVENTYTYHDTSKNDGSSWLGWTGAGPQKDVIARNNYWIGGESAIDVKWWYNVTYENNVSVTTTSFQVFLETRSDQPTSKYIWRNNRYYGVDRFRWQSTNYTFANWKARTGLDVSGSTFSTARPSGTEIFVRPNKYEPGRAHIAVYNWTLQNTVNADVSSVLKSGDAFEVRDAQNYYGAPVLTGVYNGTPLVLPMSLTAVAAPSGAARVAPVHTSKEFNAFVLIKR